MFVHDSGTWPFGLKAGYHDTTLYDRICFFEHFSHDLFAIHARYDMSFSSSAGAAPNTTFHLRVPCAMHSGHRFYLFQHLLSVRLLVVWGGLVHISRSLILHTQARV